MKCEILGVLTVRYNAIREEIMLNVDRRINPRILICWLRDGTATGQPKTILHKRYKGATTPKGGRPDGTYRSKKGDRSKPLPILKRNLTVFNVPNTPVARGKFTDMMNQGGER